MELSKILTVQALCVFSCWVRCQTLSGSLIPKYWLSTTPQTPPPSPSPWEAETDTILKTEKPLGKSRDPWNEKDHVTAISHDQKVTTTRLVRFCMLSRVLPIRIR